MLQRSKKLRNFGDLWSFPAGKEDLVDKKNGSKFNLDSGIQCCLRETFEEIGIFLLPD